MRMAWRDALRHNSPMGIVALKTDADYQAALSSMESLWGAAPGSADAARLEALSVLVEAYENEHYPIDTPEGSD